MTDESIKVLVVGGGGREHALAWKLACSDRVSAVYVAPGNAGTAREPGVHNIPIRAEAVDDLLEFAQSERIDMTVVGPEGPLVEGIVDLFSDAGLACLGPRQDAAQLEGSKSFAKAFLQRHGIPTAGHRVFADAGEALGWLDHAELPLVLKADGLAAGKGVVIAQNLDEARQAVTQILVEGRFGKAGERLVVEDYLIGEEASFICLVAGSSVVPLATSQDHKTRDAGDCGPNTGGMGAYSPAPVVDPDMHQRIMRQVIEPTVNGLAAEEIPYCGFLYAGLMIDATGVPHVLEFNCRLGDPETQPILLRLRSDLAVLCQAALDGTLDQRAVQWDSRPALGVVMTAAGYPDHYPKGDIITGLDEAESDDIKIFHAGTDEFDGQTVTNGGRVLCVTALGESIGRAQNAAYASLKKIHWQGAYWRDDIGYKALKRETRHQNSGEQL